MQPFSLLIKPASADCNLRCEYCFYLEKCHLYPDSKRHRMSEDVLEQMVRTYMATEQPVYTFGWQGGEPTLMEIEFFRKVTDLQKKYGRSGAVVANGLQTNATLINDSLAAHFARFRFLLGCSLDGPPEIHDRYRVTAGGKPTHGRVLKGLETLNRNGVEYNILILVSKANIRKAREVYRYLVHNGFYYHQYIPCVEFDAEGKLLPFAIQDEEWGEFLCALFDEWYPQDINRASIRHFDAVINKMVNETTDVCTLSRNCCQYFVIEHNGDIYPCDFFVQKNLKIGNIMEITWKEALTSPIYRSFGGLKSRWHKDCKLCDCLNVCNGDCLKHRIYDGNPSDNLSWLCNGWRQFIRHSRVQFQEITQAIKSRLDLQLGGVGRNVPCPCGSGRKFKKCCGR